VTRGIRRSVGSLRDQVQSEGTTRPYASKYFRVVTLPLSGGWGLLMIEEAIATSLSGEETENFSRPPQR
jgi:hypothetical protein